MFESVCSFYASNVYTTLQGMICGVAVSELVTCLCTSYHIVSPCVFLLSHATVLKPKIHIDTSLCAEKSIMLLPLPLSRQYICFSGLSSEFIKTQPLTCYVFLSPTFFCLFISLTLLSFYFTHFYEIICHFRQFSPFIFLSLYLFFFIFSILSLFLASFLLFIHDNTHSIINSIAILLFLH